MIGAQLFGLRNDLGKDRAGTLCILKKMGFQAIEPTVSLAHKSPLWNPSAWTMPFLQERFMEVQEIGLTVPSVHVDLGLFGKSAEKIIAMIRQIKMKTGISVFVFSGMFSTEKKAKKWGELLHRVSDAVKDAGCTILYHNHDMEFHTVSGKMILDVFFEYAGSDVGLQLDIGWAGMAWDEIKAADEYADRIVEIHCKDFAGGRGQYTSLKIPQEMFVPIGTGIIETEEIVRMASGFPRFSGMFIIDQDSSTGDLVEDMRIGLDNLRGMKA